MSDTMTRLADLGRAMIAAGWTVTPEPDGWFGWKDPDGIWFRGDSETIPPSRATFHYQQRLRRAA